MGKIEIPDYKVVKSNGNIEIRDYAPIIVAEVNVQGERKEAIRKGFRILADYIFGNNTLSSAIKMTAPVTQELNKTIPMTAPVMEQKDKSGWKIRFVMPKNYSLDNIPKPNNKMVVLSQIPSKRFAVIRFSGFANDTKIKDQTKYLESFIDTEGLKKIGESVLAFYNPPWTLPFLRRNEVMIEVEF